MEMAATFERSEPGIHRWAPPRGLLTEAMGDWLASIADRLDRPVADLLQHRARSLAGVYLAEWGEPVLPLDGPRGNRFVDRVAGALAFHSETPPWLRKKSFFSRAASCDPLASGCKLV